jgi:thiol-disulfide isomerase/thioredoxin
MTKYFLFLVLSFATMQACSQAPSTTPATTTPSPAKPAAVPAYASEKAGWLVDLDEAYNRSVKEKKPILANFTGSDWCGWCKKLDADVFTKPEFQTWEEPLAKSGYGTSPWYHRLPDHLVTQHVQECFRSIRSEWTRQDRIYTYAAAIHIDHR